MATSTKTADLVSKNTILTRKLNNVMYELMVKTNSDMVYIDDTTTLTEILSDLSDMLTDTTKSTTQLKADYSELTNGSPDSFNTFKEVWDYVNANGNPKSALIELIESKQTKEDGKGLSSNDLTDILYEKLVNGYTKEELDAKFKIIVDNAAPADLSLRVDSLEQKPNIDITTSSTAPSSTIDGSCWYQIIRKD